jgi:hypothetical protein
MRWFMSVTRGAEKYLGVEFFARFAIQPRQSVGGGMGSAPVRHHKAGIMPVPLQYLVEQEIAAASIRAVEMVIGAHHCCGIASLDGKFEGKQIALPRGGFGYLNRYGVLQRLLSVQGIMFDCRHDMLVLDGADGLARQGSSK